MTSLSCGGVGSLLREVRISDVWRDADAENTGVSSRADVTVLRGRTRVSLMTSSVVMSALDLPARLFKLREVTGV